MLNELIGLFVAAMLVPVVIPVVQFGVFHK